MPPRAADDFETIRARVEELRRERAGNVGERRLLPERGSRPYAVSSGSGSGRPEMSPALQRVFARLKTGRP